MTEQIAYQVIKQKLIPDLIDNNEIDEMSPVDWYSPQLDMGIEYKNRNYYFSSVIIEKSKYDELMKYNKARYINAIPQGYNRTWYFSWDLKKIPEPKWAQIDLKNSQQFYRDSERINKLAGFLPIVIAKNITNLII